MICVLCAAGTVGLGIRGRSRESGLRWNHEGAYVDKWVTNVRDLCEARGPNKEVSSCSDCDTHAVFEPAELPIEWKQRFYDELSKMPRNVDSSRFLYGTTAPHTDCGGLTERNSEYRFIVLHLNSGTSGTTWMLRWLPSVIGKYFGKITFEIFVCDVQTRFSRAAAAGVRCH